MKIPYLYAEELKKRYIVYASFYNVVNDERDIPFRNLLEIYTTDYYSHCQFTNTLDCLPILTIEKTSLLAAQHQGTPDSIFIMMNPGSSKPMDKMYNIPTFPIDQHLPHNILKNPLVRAIPDTAQYQIMNIMSYKNWKHVRVINLSDLRDAKSTSFMKNIHELNEMHTVFSQNRSLELSHAMTNSSIPVFAAWGRDKKLVPLAKQCLSALPNTHKVTGVQYPEDEACLFAYPSPPLKSHKMIWLEKFATVLSKPS